jgi:hypothetical protein
MSGRAITTRRYSVQQPGSFIPRFLTNMIAGANAGTAASTVQMANGQYSDGEMSVIDCSLFTLL